MTEQRPQQSQNNRRGQQHLRHETTCLPKNLLKSSDAERSEAEEHSRPDKDPTGWRARGYFSWSSGEAGLDQVPYLRQAKPAGPVGDVGAVDLVVADFEHAGDVAEVFVGAAFAVELQLLENDVLRGGEIRLETCTAELLARGARLIPPGARSLRGRSYRWGSKFRIAG